MKLNKNAIATTIEQYDTIKLLGIPDDTADMKYMTVYDEFDEEPHMELVPKSFIQLYDDERPSKEIPAWSLTKMMDILPNTIAYALDPTNPRCRYDVHLSKYQFVDKVTMHQISYGNCFTRSGSWKPIVTSPERENMIDCIIVMLQWIKDNNFIDYYAYKNRTERQTASQI